MVSLKSLQPKISVVSVEGSGLETKNQNDETRQFVNSRIVEVKVRML